MFTTSYVQLYTYLQKLYRRLFLLITHMHNIQLMLPFHRENTMGMFIIVLCSVYIN